MGEETADQRLNTPLSIESPIKTIQRHLIEKTSYVHGNTCLYRGKDPTGKVSTANKQYVTRQTSWAEDIFCTD